MIAAVLMWMLGDKDDEEEKRSSMISIPQ